MEYGEAEIEITENPTRKDLCVLIYDDVLTTGGTAETLVAKLLKRMEVMPIQFSFLIELNFLNSRKKLSPYSWDIVSLVSYG